MDNVDISSRWDGLCEDNGEVDVGMLWQYVNGMERSVGMYRGRTVAS